MLVSASDHQVTRRKFSQREAKEATPTMFTRAQAATNNTSATKSVTTTHQHNTTSANSASTTHTSVSSGGTCTLTSTSGGDDAVPSVSVTITAVAASVPEGGLLLTSSAITPAPDTPTITNLVLNSLEGVHSGVPTRTTPTLTPTTLRNIEQTFLELSTVQPPETHTNQAGFVPPLVHPSGNTFVSVDSKCWGGGTLTQVANTSTSSSSSSSSSAGGVGGVFLRNAPSPATAAQPTTSAATTTTHHLTMPAQIQQHQPPRRTGGRRPFKDDSMSREEEDRRSMRRERNKLAAARCRKRRLDQTNMLQDETDDLEDRKSELQNEIQLLQQQRDELEFLLATHKAVCRRRLVNAPAVTTAVSAPVTSAVSAAPTPVTTATQAIIPPLVRVDVPVVVKEEPFEDEEIVREKVVASEVVRLRRPTSLNVAPVALRTPSVADLGVPIETPSAGLRGLNFESMMEGGTGLTPVTSGTGLTPLHTGLTPLATPVVTGPSGVPGSSNCGTQQRSSSSDLSSPDAVPPKLVSL
ncbi:hypothetical protein Pmani_039945 [Petrolisthes manimaculis]|uniref:BZIP domain-containing protein n=1 Tax=Petrolisthes manimaculis TaxID=1843537 RepID=A0AAE1NBJ7_9EUCA|nr:hypothetical protein Pmani_039945 [Petrolisthes manimaculis]